MSINSVPGCIGYFGKPVGLNNCQGCSWADVCKKVVAKERLQKLLADVQEAKAIARGEK
jgi:Fe-S cluster biogenesis protein NfuA